MRIMHVSRATMMIYLFLRPTIEAQRQKGHYVCVCGADDLYAQKLRELGFIVMTHQMKRSLNPLNIFIGILRVKKLLLEHKIDAVVCHGPIGGAVGRIAACLTRTPKVIYFVHGFVCVPGQRIFKWLTWLLIEKLFGRITTAVILMNNYDEDLCKKYRIIHNADKIFRIPGMGVDLSQYNSEDAELSKQELVRDLGICGDHKLVLLAARLIPEKGIFQLLEAARRCSERDDVCFLVAGDGPSRNALEKGVREHNLEETFKILGWREDVDFLMKFSDIYTLPTYDHEGLPVTILEAMACGKPVITTRHRGCEDSVIDGETGFLVPIKQVNPLVEKIVYLLDNEKERVEMGLAGRRHVEQHFELVYCTDKIMEALEQVIGQDNDH